jgi:hypothetical protein
MLNHPRLQRLSAANKFNCGCAPSHSGPCAACFQADKSDAAMNNLRGWPALTAKGSCLVRASSNTSSAKVTREGARTM